MTKTAVKKDVKVTERLYKAISAPLVTEKATMAAEQNKVSFIVPLTSTKPLIKEAIEALFKVKVLNVNTVLTKGKVKVFKGRKGLRNDTKKAIVTLAEGETIDMATGV